MSESKSIKETKELFKGLGLVFKTVKSVAKDGKIDFSDLADVAALAKNSSVLIEAAKGVNEVPLELKDLSKEEILEIIGLIYAEVT